MIEHLLAAERASGRTPDALLNAPACPEGAEELWRIFGELHSCRSWANGPARISYSDVDAFQRVAGVVLEPWELAAIGRADQAYLTGYAAKQAKP